VPRGRGHFIEWYTGHARAWLRPRVEKWKSRVGVDLKAIEVRDLGFRWGSCGKGGALNFHWALILLPPSIVEYVVVHELVHLVEPNHTPEFWLAVERAMPDFEARKKWLAEHGGRLVAL
jgi:predicted metal-dependent hydrolase